jgi:hypothetical protein
MSSSSSASASCLTHEEICESDESDIDREEKIGLRRMRDRKEIGMIIVEEYEATVIKIIRGIELDEIKKDIKKKRWMIEYVDSTEKTLLYYAVMSGREEIAKLIIKLISTKMLEMKYNNDSILHITASKNMEDLVIKIMERVSLNSIFDMDHLRKTVYYYIIINNMHKAKRILDKNCGKFECCICMEEYIDEIAYTPKCSYKHRICRECYDRMTIKRCPICRNSIF